RPAVHMHRPCPADVDGAELAAFEEKRAAGFPVVHQFHRLDRHDAANHQTVEISERAAQLARGEKTGEVKRLAQLLGGHGDDVLRTRHPADGALEHGHRLAKTESAGKKNSFQSISHLRDARPRTRTYTTYGSPLPVRTGTSGCP